MLNSFTFDDPVHLHENMCNRFLFGRLGHEYNWKGTSEVGMDNLTLGARTLEMDYDLKDLWLTEHRWRMMVRQYIDPEALDETLGMVETYLSSRGKAKRGIATLRLNETIDPDDPGPYIEELRTKTVASRKGGRVTSRRWGSCMLSLTFRTIPTPTVCLSSRTSYFGYLAMMDMAVAHQFGRLCGRRIGINVADMQFVWHLNLAQFHGFRCLAWTLGDKDRRKEVTEYIGHRDKVPVNKPGLYKAVVGFERITRADEEGLLYGDETFASHSRMRRRYHTEVLGYKYGRQFEGGTHTDKTQRFRPLPSLNVADLDFSALGR